MRVSEFKRNRFKNSGIALSPKTLEKAEEVQAMLTKMNVGEISFDSLAVLEMVYGDGGAEVKDDYKEVVAKKYESPVPQLQPERQPARRARRQLVTEK